MVKANNFLKQARSLKVFAILSFIRPAFFLLEASLKPRVYFGSTRNMKEGMTEKNILTTLYRKKEATRAACGARGATRGLAGP